MSELYERRERRERAYKIAHWHHQRCLADLAEARDNASFFSFNLEWERIASKLREQAPYLMYEFRLNRHVDGFYSNFNEISEQKAHERHNKVLNKRNKIAVRAEKYSEIHTKALIKLQDYLELIGEPVV